jgi:hypothetical protein
MVIAKTTKIREGLYKATSLPCPQCQQVLTTEIPSQQLFLYNQNAPIGKVLPDLSLEDRERFISGYCQPCWNNLFPNEDEENN